MATATVKSSETDGLVLKVRVKDAESEAHARHVAEEIAEHVAQALTFEYSTFFRTPRVNETCTKKEDGSFSLGTTKRVAAAVQTCHLGLGPNAPKEVKKVLEETRTSGSEYYRLFHSALSLTDTISKFMVLYLILVILNDDEQKKVDRFVLSVEPCVATGPRYRERNNKLKDKRNEDEPTVRETVYTRLRNELAHRREDERGCRRSVESIEEAMKANMQGLIRIVKEAIRKGPQATP